ncbi:nicotinamide mononucleotide transporter [Weissella cibaria]|uniref:nicotinamide mononucleotide transporter n=1 Tax=Weissella cibaria TaxID=137591 RepID=UPI000A8E36D2|nr:nicotinamide mononucleotide transporter [Weissella cibaria]
MQYFKQALREATSPINIKRDLALMNRFQRVYMAVTIWAFVYTGDYSSSGWTSLITGLVLAFYLIMLASGRLTNFFWGLLTNGIWLLMSIHNHLVGDILNQGFFFVMQFVGMVA